MSNWRDAKLVLLYLQVIVTSYAVLYGWSKAMLLLPGAKLAVCEWLPSGCLIYNI